MFPAYYDYSSMFAHAVPWKILICLIPRVLPQTSLGVLYDIWFKQHIVYVRPETILNSATHLISGFLGI